MSLALIIAAAISAAAAIRVDRTDVRPPAFYLLKPLTTVLIIALAWLQVPANPLYQQLVLLALGLSLLGDIALMFHGNRWFLAGLGSFLLAHIAFVAAFSTGIDAFSLPPWSLVSPLAAAIVLPVIWPGAGRLRLAVVPYGLVLVAMFMTSAARFDAAPSTPALLAVIGAGLFQLSDTALGVRRFVREYRFAQALILSTYWLAISLIALSVAAAT